MPTEELKQALLGGSTATLGEMVAEVLELDKRVVAKVLWALSSANTRFSTHDERAEFDWMREHLGDIDLRNAIGEAMAFKLLLRKARYDAETRNGRMLLKQVFLPNATEPNESICKGCANSVRCLVENTSTPEKCWDSKRVETTIIRINTDHTADVAVDEFETPLRISVRKLYRKEMF